MSSFLDIWTFECLDVWMLISGVRLGGVVAGTTAGLPPRGVSADGEGPRRLSCAPALARPLLFPLDAALPASRDLASICPGPPAARVTGAGGDLWMLNSII